MLTRFFRDAAISCPTNLKSIKIENMGSERETKSVELLDKSFPQKSAATIQVKRSNNSSHFEVLPANRSSLSPYKAIQASKLKCSSDLVQYEKKFLHSGRKIMQLQNREVIDLSGNSLLDKKPRKEEAIAPCSNKKRKVINTELDACISNASEIASCAEISLSSYPLSRTCLGKHEKPQMSDSRSRQNAEVSALQCKVDGTLRRRDADFLSQKSEDVLSSVSGHEETKGSTFLIQVKEELSATEYKEFVGFMKSLKSKAMKIGHVLQSIANLFSGPERLPLLRRFKDYVPAKYQSIYEQYLPTNG